MITANTTSSSSSWCRTFSPYSSPRTVPLVTTTSTQHKLTLPSVRMRPERTGTPFRSFLDEDDPTHIKSWFSGKSLTRNSWEDEIANVNFLYDDIAHALQNTINSCINSARDRRGYVLERRFTKISEITQCNGHYAVQGHSRSPILVPIKRSYTTSY